MNVIPHGTMISRFRNTAVDKERQTMARKKQSTQEQLSKTKVKKKPGGSDNMDEAAKKKDREIDPKPKEEMKSIDEWVYED